MQANQNSVMVTVIIASLILLVGGIFAYMSIPTPDEVAAKVIVPSSSDIASKIVIPQAPAAPVVPTAEEIAAAIDIPATDISISDDKTELAKSLSIEFITTSDFKKTIANYINDHTIAEDIMKGDLTSINVIDSDSSIYWYGQTSATVYMKVKVNFDDFGDAEWVRLKMQCHVTDLDRSEGYENADVSSCSIDNITSSSY